MVLPTEKYYFITVDNGMTVDAFHISSKELAKLHQHFDGEICVYYPDYAETKTADEILDQYGIKKKTKTKLPLLEILGIE